MKAQDIMSRNPSVVTPTTPLEDAARVMKREEVGILPVVESEGSRQLVGVLTDRDIAMRVVAEGRDTATTSVGHVMTSNVRICRPDDDVDHVMRVMGDEQVRRIPIVDDRGTLVGIVAQADIVIDTSDAREAEKTIEKISKPGGKHTA
jgi:CBS domain-containing protein